MNTNTLWNETVQIPARSPLPGDLTADLAVIGGGMAGILTAFYLSQRGKQVVVLEADRIGNGQTSGTTAKLTIQHGLIYHSLRKKRGPAIAALYKEANEQAFQEMERLIKNRSISCDLEKQPSFLYTRTDETPLHREYEAAKALKIPAWLTKNTSLPFSVKEALCFPDQAQFHPLKFLKEISRSLTVFEHTPVTSVEDFGSVQLLKTHRGTVSAKDVVFACHYPFPLLPGYFFLRMYQSRSYLLALEHAPKVHGMYLGIEADKLTLRDAGNLLLFGGGERRTGNIKMNSEKDLETAALRLYPNARIRNAFSAQDCMTLDHIPYIGAFSSKRPHWYLATGFGKWGMTASMASALLLTDLICKGSSPFAPLYDPGRFPLRASVKELSMHGAIVARGLIRGLGKEALTCPHMGCKLSWNPADSVWECPCHGSRFDRKGKLLDGPAQTSPFTKKQPRS